MGHDPSRSCLSRPNLHNFALSYTLNELSIDVDSARDGGGESLFCIIHFGMAFTYEFCPIRCECLFCFEHVLAFHANIVKLESFQLPAALTSNCGNMAESFEYIVHLRYSGVSTTLVTLLNASSDWSPNDYVSYPSSHQFVLHSCSHHHFQY